MVTGADPGYVENLRERYPLFEFADVSTTPYVLMTGGLYWDGSAWVKNTSGGLVGGTVDITYNVDGSPATIIEVRAGRTLTSTYTWGAGTLNITEVVT